MKYISTFLLLTAFACMLYMGTGQMMLSTIEINGAEREAANNSTKPVSHITITATDLTSGKAHLIGSHELNYDGKLYDIIAQGATGACIAYTVRWDEREEGLIGELCEHIEHLIGTTTSGKGTKHLTKNIVKDYFAVRHSFVLITSISFPTVYHISVSDLSAVSAEILSPPPQA